MSRPMILDADRERRKIRLVKLITDSPGGITNADINRVMGRLKQTAVTALMNSLSDELCLWEQTDESGDTWYHHPKWNHLYEKGAPEVERKKIKRGRKIRPASIDEDTYWKIREYLTETHSKTTMIEFITTAVEEKIARERAK